MNYNALQDLTDFLGNSPTPWHATCEIGNRLAQQDFTPLDEQERWNLQPGGAHFVERGGSTCAFILPKETPSRGTILGSHTDSPALKSILGFDLYLVPYEFPRILGPRCDMLASYRLDNLASSHAFHPGYKKKYDQENAPELGKGVVIKYNANQRYATSGLTAAHIVKLCQEHKLPYQSFASESNLPCGSTVGAIAAAQTGIQTVDIGLAQYSMHAARELIATTDHLHLCKLLKALLEA